MQEEAHRLRHSVVARVLAGSTPVFLPIIETGRSAVWLARSAGGRKVVSSNLTVPTKGIHVMRASRQEIRLKSTDDPSTETGYPRRGDRLSEIGT